MLQRVIVLVLSSASAFALDVAATKAALRGCALRADRGFAATPSLRSELSQLVESLERHSDAAAAPTASPMLLGRWTLDYTDASDVLSLRILPPASLCDIGDIVQEIQEGEEDGVFRASNEVQLSPRGAGLVAGVVGAPALTGLYAVDAVLKALDAQRLQLVFVGGRTQPFVAPFELPALSAQLPAMLQTALQSLVGERIYLQTTFLDDDLRIARGPRKELYVLSKR